MPRERTSMRKTKEILRLSLAEGLGQRDIALSTGVGKTTIQELLAKVKAQGKTWEDLKHMRETEIVEQIAFPGHKPKSSSKGSTPDWSRVRSELLKKGNTLALLWMDYRQEHPMGIQYSQFCLRYRMWEKESHLVLKHHHVAGEKMFVDFSGLTVPWIDRHTGEIHEAQIFVACLGASNYTFAKASSDQSLSRWIDLHVAAFDFFQGVPKAIVPDNLRSGVSRACRYDPETNPTYLSLAEHYNTAIIPTRARKPRDKAKVEVAVQIVQRWILAILRRQTFTSIEEINEHIKPLLENLNNKTMRHLGASRKELWEKYEKPELKELPNVIFEIPTWKIAKVSIDYHIECGRHYYSVPFRYVGAEVRIKLTRSLIEVFHQSEIISTHKRVENAHYRHSTIAEHMPPKHAEYVKWTPEKILDWAQTSGKATRTFCEQIIASRKHPEQGFRTCLGVLRLEKTYDQDRLEKACSMALGMKSYRYRTVLDILRSKKDKVNQNKKSIPTPVNIPAHENIRGSSYYQ